MKDEVKLTTSQIADQISAKLQIFAADEKINTTSEKTSLKKFDKPWAKSEGAMVEIRYNHLAGTSKLGHEEAMAYLLKLRAGKTVRHYEN